MSIVLIGIISIYVMYMKIIKKENIVFLGNYGMAVIMSGSMEPSLSLYDLTIIKKEKDYNNDDIVVYNENNNLVVHRIVEKTDDFITTKGDANDIADLPIIKENIKGKVVKAIPNLGKIILYMSNPMYISLTIILIALFDLLFKRRVNNN